MTNKEKQKKDIERVLISRLLTDLGINTTDVLDHESPDFIINYEGKRIGLEVETCHSLKIETNGKLCVAATNDCLYKILKEYKELIIARGEKSKGITVSFCDGIYMIPKINRHKEEIFKEIDNILEYNRGGEWKDCKYISNASEYHLDIDFVDVSMSDAYWGTSAKESNILHCIKHKEDMLPIYKDRTKDMDVKEFWLVIDFIRDRDTDIRYIQMPIPDTKYDRVYLTKYGDITRIK